MTNPDFERFEQIRAEERSRIYREVVEPLVEALEKHIRWAEYRFGNIGGADWNDADAGDSFDALETALATAREQMGKP